MYLYRTRHYCLTHTTFLYSKVYVSTTQKNYTQGEFVANLLLQGTFHTSDAKVTGFIKTCENKAYFDQDDAQIR